MGKVERDESRWNSAGSSGHKPRARGSTPRGVNSSDAGVKDVVVEWALGETG